MFVALNAVLILGGQAKIAELMFPYLALACGAILYIRYPVYHVGFVFWLIFLTPFVRRLIDYQAGFNPVSPVMLAPYLVAALPVFTVLRMLPQLQHRLLFPFFLILGGVLYGFLIGIVLNGPFSATFDLIQWGVPIIFAAYIGLGALEYEDLGRMVRSTFVWGTFVMGVYGVWQYFFLPAWDAYWMASAPLSSIGLPVPQLVRVFSTMNTPGPYANAMMAGLLLAIGVKHWLKWFAAGPGFAGFLLSLVRAAWGGWAVGLGWMLYRGGGAGRFRLLIVLGLLAAAFFPFTLIDTFSEAISNRFESISNLGQDSSMMARVRFYEDFLLVSFSNFVGDGLGSTGLATKLSNAGSLGQLASFDSGIMILPFTLGWVGGILYIGGMVWIVRNALGRVPGKDALLVTAQGITIGIVAQIFFGNIVTGVGGIIFWFFAALCLLALRQQQSGDPASG